MNYLYLWVIASSVLLEIMIAQLSSAFSSKQILLGPNSYTMVNMISQDLTNEIMVDNTDISAIFTIKSVRLRA